VRGDPLLTRLFFSPSHPGSYSALAPPGQLVRRSFARSSIAMLRVVQCHLGWSGAGMLLRFLRRGSGARSLPEGGPSRSIVRRLSTRSFNACPRRESEALSKPKLLAVKGFPLPGRSWRGVGVPVDARTWISGRSALHGPLRPFCQPWCSADAGSPRRCVRGACSGDGVSVSKRG